MKLMDKNYVEELETEHLPGRKKYAQEVLGNDVELEIDWESFGEGFSEQMAAPVNAARHFFTDIVNGMKAVLKTAAGKEAIASKNVEKITCKHNDGASFSIDFQAKSMLITYDYVNYKTFSATDVEKLLLQTL